MVGDARVDARMVGLGASDAERDDANQVDAALRTVRQHERAAGIALARIFAALLRVAGAHHAAVDGRFGRLVQVLADRLRYDRHLDFLQDLTAFAARRRRAPSSHVRLLADQIQTFEARIAGQADRLDEFWWIARSNNRYMMS